MSDYPCIPHAVIPPLLIGAFALGIGCNEPPSASEPRTCLDVAPKEVPDFLLSRQTEDLDIYIEEGRFVCAGSANDYQHHVTLVARELSIDIQRKISLYVTLTPWDWCSVPGSCVRSDGVAFSFPGATYHELVHAVACQTRRGAPPMLSEGVAVMFDGQPLSVTESPHGVPSTFSDVRDGFNPYYLLAGHFIRWLHDDLGPDAFRDLYRTATFTQGVWSAIEAAYGPTVEADYLTTAPAMWVPHRQCDDVPLLEPDGGIWTYEAHMDCEDPATFGPYERGGPSYTSVTGLHMMYQSFLIDVQTPGNYRFDRPDYDTWVSFQRCLDRHPATRDEVKAEWVDHGVWFNFQNVGRTEFEHRGLWRVDILRPYGPPSDVGMIISPE